MKRIYLLVFLISSCLIVMGCESSSQGSEAPLGDTPTLFSAMSPLPQADTTHLDIGGTRLFVRSIGEGPTLVVIHGGPGMSHHYLSPSLDYLSRGYRVVYYDQRLSGLSSPACDTSDIRLARWIEDLEELRGHLGVDSIMLLSHSWGALVAMKYAAQYPDRVTGLVFFNPVAAEAGLQQAAAKTLQARLNAEDQLMQEKLIGSPGFQNAEPEAVLAAYRFSFAQSVFHRDALDSLQLYIPDRPIMRQQHLSLLYKDPEMQLYNLYAQMEQIQVPVLVVHGSYDATPLEASQKLIARCSQGQLALIQDSGHFSFLETPREVASVLEKFLWEKVQGPLLRQ